MLPWVFSASRSSKMGSRQKVDLRLKQQQYRFGRLPRFFFKLSGIFLRKFTGSHPLILRDRRLNLPGSQGEQVSTIQRARLSVLRIFVLLLPRALVLRLFRLQLFGIRLRLRARGSSSGYAIRLRHKRGSAVGNGSGSPNGFGSPTGPNGAAPGGGLNSAPGDTFGGGPIVGVGLPSKESIKIFKKQTHYNQWEFVTVNQDFGGASGQSSRDAAAERYGKQYQRLHSRRRE